MRRARSSGDAADVLQCGPNASWPGFHGGDDAERDVRLGRRAERRGGRRRGHRAQAGQHDARAVAREIATLRLMSHPGIARLVSSFKWRDGIYLVLEVMSSMNSRPSARAN